MASLSERIREKRLSLGLTQHELADRTGITQARVSQIERGNGADSLPWRTLTLIAAALEVDLPDLIGDDPAYHELDLADVWQDNAAAPRPPGPLIGRGDDLATIRRHILDGETRLITLTGPGGVGKTHLALSAGQDVAAEFDDVNLVVLASCEDAAHAVSAIAHAIGLRERDAQPLRDRLVDALRRTRRLLVLDSVERALPSVAWLLAELLAACPPLTLLVTSRQALRIRGEYEHQVEPLSLPDIESGLSLTAVAASPAVRLFQRRAAAASAYFALTPENAATIAEIVRRLDGLPLAIELAAVRARTVPPAAMLPRLDTRLAFLTHGPLNLPLRQRSLRAAMQWSHDLLEPSDQELFRRLAIFAGGFTIDAVEALAVHGARRDPHAGSDHTSLPERVSALLDWNLLTRTVEADGSHRFGMLETIQEFAQERLAAAGETEEFRRRHLEWCLSLATQSLPRMYTAEEHAWLRRLQQEDVNFQTALSWAFGPGKTGNLETGLRLAGALVDYWYVSGRLSEGRAWLIRGIELSATEEPSTGQARTLVGACLIEQTLAADEPAQAHGEKGLQMATSLGDDLTMGRALLALGNLAVMREDCDRGRSMHEDALALFRRCDDRSWTALALLNLGLVSHRQAQLEQAEGYVREALVIAGEVGDSRDVVSALCLLGDLSHARGDLEAATSRYAESVALGWQIGSVREVADALSGMSAVAVATVDYEWAARLLYAAEIVYRRLGIDLPPPLRPNWFELAGRVEKGLGTDRFALARASTTPEKAIQEMIALNHRGG